MRSQIKIVLSAIFSALIMISYGHAECCQPLIELNEKNHVLYQDKDVFLVSDSDWRTALSSVPMTTWRDQSLDTIIHPLLMFHDDITHEAYIQIGAFTSHTTVPAGAYQTFTAEEDYVHKVLMRLTPGMNDFTIELRDMEDTVLATSETKSPEGYVYEYFYLGVPVTVGEKYKIVFLEENNQYITLGSVYPGGDYSENRNFDVDMHIYGSEKDTFEADSIIHFLQLFKPSKLTVIGEAPQELLDMLIIPEGEDQDLIQQYPNDFPGPGLDPEQIYQAGADELLNYWSEYHGVVLVDYDNYEAGLMAAVYASYFNMPLLFVSSSNIQALEEDLQGKRYYIVDGIDADTRDVLQSIGTIAIELSKQELQQEYRELTGTDKILLVNTVDRENYIDDTIFPEKSATSVIKLFGKHSLAAPILAAGREEIIFDMKDYDVTWSPRQYDCEIVPEVDDNVEKVDEAVETISNTVYEDQAEYLTIIACPRAIPDSISDCTGLGTRHQRDLNYAVSPDESFGRLYGIKTDVVTDYQGGVHIVYGGVFDGERDVEYMKLEGTDGSILRGPIRLMDGLGAAYPSIASYEDSVFVASPQAQQGLYLMKLDLDGQRIWPQDIEVWTGEGIADIPDIQVDAGGDVHIVWQSRGAGFIDMYYAKLSGTDGSIMVEPLIITENMAPYLPRIALDSEGNAHIVFQFFAQGWDIYYTKISGEDGSIMLPDVLLTTPEDVYSSSPDIDVDTNDDPHILWSNKRADEEKTARRYAKLDGTSGTIVDGPRTILADNDEEVALTSIVLDEEDNINILWDNKYYDEQEVYYAKYSGETGELLSPPSVIVSEDDSIRSWRPSASIDPDGNIDVIFNDYAEGQGLHYAKIDNEQNELLASNHPLDTAVELDMNLGVGRIYGFTISDVSSYIARSLLYESIIQEIRDDQIRALVIASSSEEGNDNAKRMLDATTGAGFETTCYTHDGSDPGDPDGHREGCIFQESPDANEFFLYLDRQIITYSDHAGSTGWHKFKSEPASEYYMPWLDLPYSYGMACLTNSFWGSTKKKLFGPTLLRRGAIGYHGAVTTARFHGCELDAVKWLTSEPMDFGELNKHLVSTCPSMTTYDIFLGDPALKPQLGEVQW